MWIISWELSRKSFFLSLLYSGVLPLIYGLKIYRATVERLIKTFLAAHQFEPGLPPALALLKARFFTVGSSRRLENYYANRSLAMGYFEYHYTTGAGKSRQTHEVDVFQYTLGSIFPRILIEPNSAAVQIPFISQWRKIATESTEFNRHFTAYLGSPTGDAQLFELLEPNVIHRLNEIKSKNFFIEIAENEMSFIFERAPQHIQDLEIILELIKVIDE